MAKSALAPPRDMKGRFLSGVRKARSKARRATKSFIARSRGQKMANAKKDMLDLTTEVGKVAVPAAIASAASGYLGDKIKIAGKVDARLAAAAGGAALTMFGGNLGGYKGTIQSATVGVLASWLAEEAFGVGMDQKRTAAPAAAEVAPIPGTNVNGLMVGNVYDGVGDAEKRLARKLARIKKRAVKRGVDWKDVRAQSKDIAEEKGWDQPEPESPRPVVIKQVAPPARRRVALAPAYFRRPAAYSRGRVLVRR